MKGAKIKFNLFKFGISPKAGNIAAYLFVLFCFVFYTAQSYSALCEI